MSTVIPVYFDYASSLCYIAAVLGRQLEADLDIVLDWRPVEIAARNAPWKPGDPIDTEARARIERVSQETGVAVLIPARWMDSRPALEGALLAKDRGCFAEYHRRVFAAAFVQGEDIGDRYVLTRIADGVGLPIGDFMMAIATRARARQLAGHAAAAVAHGVTGYPTFLLGEFPLTGIQPLDTMRQLICRYLDRVGGRVLQ
jgi:predicted DsbA family dithiol-disulfide isomerase